MSTGSKSLIETGDTFLFNGLVGSTQTDKRTLTVLEVTITGDLKIHVHVNGDRVKSVFWLPYSEALRLMEENIWEYEGKVGN